MFIILADTATAGAEAAKTGLFETFGVNWPFFIAQLINFVIVFLVLKICLWTDPTNFGTTQAAHCRWRKQVEANRATTR
jgi:hypothetical protein